MSTTPRYVATLPNVREVSLVGTADLAFWKAHLNDAPLAPVEAQGKARLLIGASAARFMGLAFAEFSCLLVVPPSGSGWRDAAYLVHAFNSRRFFAFCERVMYSTPYHHGRVGVSASDPPSVDVRADDGGTYHAALGTDANNGPRQPSRSAAERWNGPIFLPGPAGGDDGRGSRVFFGKLEGFTRAFPFDPTCDRVEIARGSSGGVFGMLLDSGFLGEEWIIRETAVHARSKTSATPNAMASYRPDAA